MICQFGEPTRGLSPYGTPLAAALKNRQDIILKEIDYKSAYPSFLHPAPPGPSHDLGILHWGKPYTWHEIATMPSQILHIQHWSPALASYLWPLSLLAKKAGKKIAITVHNPLPHERLPFFHKLEESLLFSADYLITHNPRGKTTLAKRLGRRAPPIAVIPHGIETKTIPGRKNKRDYEELGLDPNKRYILLFGNLRGYKGVLTLLRAWATTVHQFPDVNLIIAGRFWGGEPNHWARLVARILGTYKEAKSISKQLKDPRLSGRVILRDGFQTDAELDALLRICDFCVFPYEHFHSQSGAACRAAGLGCPILVTDVGGLPMIAINENWKTRPRSIKFLAKALKSRLALSPKDLQDARAEQVRHASQYHWSQIAQQHAKLYRDMLTDKNPIRPGEE